MAEGQYKIDGVSIGNEDDVVAFGKELFDIANEKKSKLHTEWRDYEAFYGGDHWGIGGKNNKKRPGGLSMVTVNHVFNVLDGMIANMNQTPMNIQVKPLEGQDAKQADVLNSALSRLFAATDTSRKDYWDKSITCDHFAALHRSSWMKVIWNPHLYEHGDVQFQVVDPYRIYPDPSVNALEDCGFFFDRAIMPLHQIRLMFPENGQRVMPDVIPSDAHRPGDERASASGQVSTVQSGVSPPAETYYYEGVRGKIFTRTKGVAAVYFLYIRDNGAIHKYTDGVEDIEGADGEILKNEPIREEAETNWTRIVFTKNVLLEFKAFPYLHGELPYNQEKFIDDGTFYGQDFVKQLLDPQNAINRYLSNLLDYVKKATNPTSFINIAANIDMDLLRSGMWGQNVPSAIDPTRAVHTMTLPPIPREIFAALEIMTNLMEDLGSAQDVIQGKRPGSVTSGKAIQTLQLAAGSRIALRYKSKKGRVRNDAKQAIALMKQYYIVPQWMEVAGEDGVGVMREIDRNDMKGEWDVTVSGDLDMTTSMEAKFAKMVQFLQIASAIPPHLMMLIPLIAEQFGVPGISDAIKKTMESKMAQDNAAAQAALEQSNSPSAQGGQGALAQQ